MGLFVVARLAGEPVGCGGLKRTDKTAGEIKRVWTDPSARGIGVARRMLRRLEAWARANGLKAIMAKASARARMITFVTQKRIGEARVTSSAPRALDG